MELMCDSDLVKEVLLGFDEDYKERRVKKNKTKTLRLSFSFDFDQLSMQGVTLYTYEVL